MTVARGAIVWLPEPKSTVGHEQQGGRPAIIVSDNVLLSLRFVTMLAVVPLTSTAPTNASFYPLIMARKGGLQRSSTALPDQIRAIDKTRITRVVGHVTTAEMGAIDASLRRFLGLP